MLRRLATRGGRLEGDDGVACVQSIGTRVGATLGNVPPDVEDQERVPAGFGEQIGVDACGIESAERAHLKTAGAELQGELADLDPGTGPSHVLASIKVCLEAVNHAEAVRGERLKPGVERGVGCGHHGERGRERLVLIVLSYVGHEALTGGATRDHGEPKGRDVHRRRAPLEQVVGGFDFGGIDRGGGEAIHASGIPEQQIESGVIKGGGLRKNAHS